MAEGETPEPPEPEQKVVDKLEKRTADMKAAQKEFSKTETRLRKIEDGINAKLADLDSKIEQLAVLQAASGAPMPELNPADEATVTAYREEFPEAVGVMEALVAPVYTLISQLRDQVNGVGRQVGEYLSKAKQEEVFGAIYKVVPKAKVEEVVASQEFGEWLQTLPPAVRRTNIDIVTKTSSYTPEDALDVLSRFSKDTGIDIGLNGAARRNPPPPPPMDTGPDLRSGSSMPGERPRTPTQPKPTDPLTAYELANFKELLAEARTEAERQLLLQRLRAVPIQVDGDSSVQQFGGRVFR